VLKWAENIEVALLPAGRVLINSYKGCLLLPYSSPLYNYLIIHIVALQQPLSDTIFHNYVAKSSIRQLRQLATMRVVTLSIQKTAFSNR